MGGRVSHGTSLYGSIEPRACCWLATANLCEFLQLNRLVKVIGSALGYRFPNVFCV